MQSPFLKQLMKKQSEVVPLNINLGHFKDLIIQHLIAIRAVDHEIVDVDFSSPGNGCVRLKVYVKKEIAEDQVSVKKSGKKR